MYKYETHLHTLPASSCAIRTSREVLSFYKEIGHDGVFVTNHFYLSRVRSGLFTYEEMINNFFDDIENSKQIGKELGLKVFGGLEMSDNGADFLVYGMNREFFVQNPDFATIDLDERFERLQNAGALIIHAHPFRPTTKKRALRIFPHHVEGVEVYNTNRVGQCIKLAEMYAKTYNLPEFAGSDNHGGELHPVLSGMMSDTPITDEFDFMEKFRAGKLRVFYENNPLRNNAEGAVDEILQS